MSRRSANASAAVVSGLLLLTAGCGSGSKSTTTTSTGTTSGPASSTAAAPKAGCAKAAASLRQFQASRESLAPSLLNPSSDRAAIATTHRFSTDVQALARSVSGAAKSELDQVLAVLARDEAVLQALAARDVRRAGQESKGLGKALNDAIAQFQKICATA
jgi:hypothetical protein